MTDLVNQLIDIAREGGKRAMDIDVQFCPNLNQWVARRKDWEPGMSEGIANTAEDAAEELVESEHIRAEFERRHAEDLRIINRQFRCQSRLDGSTAAPTEPSPRR